MAEEEKVETAATEATTEAAETAEATTPAEAKKTEAKPDGEGFEQRVPYARLQKVIHERNQLREEVAAMKRDRETKATVADEDSGGDEADTLTKARQLIEDTAKKMLERELGVPLSKVRDGLTSSESVSADVAQQKWERICAEYKLDPASEDVAAFVTGLGRGGVKLDDAMKRAQNLFGPTKKAANVEETGQTGSMTNSDQVFWDHQSAVQAAAKGIRARHIGLDEVLKRQQKEAAKR